MREIVILSGKGGTGKTSVAASFAMLGKDSLVLADCDVDAADLFIVLEADFAEEYNFVSGEVAVIGQEKCDQCGICQEECRFRAISRENGQFRVNPVRCEGCGLCARLCPVGAIRNEPLQAGKYFLSRIKTGSVMAHARLSPGASNSGKLVATVREEARKAAVSKNKDIILADGSPGIGCPVISSISGASMVVFVTEPSLSGLYDLKRVAQLVKNFNVPACCIINKSDINPEIAGEIKTFLRQENIELLGEIPFDNVFNEALAQKKTVIELNNNEIGDILRSSWKRILEIT